MYITEITKWCAGSKISGLHNIHKPTIQEILNLWIDAKHTSSVLLVSCGNNETELMEHLKSIGFKKWPNMLNYGHASGKTWLMAYQIPKKIWCRETGYNGKGNWTRFNELY